MKLSKHIHSCILVEHEGVNILFDPGSYTAKEGALDVSSLKKVDHIIITHEHADHLHVPLLRDVMQKFPDANVISNASVKGILNDEGIEVMTEVIPGMNIETVPHEPLMGGGAPENTLFHVFDKLTNPGDSHQFTETRDVLLLPVQAPWGSMVNGVELAARLKPKTVIPVHDWHWRDEARLQLYDMIEDYLLRYGISFYGLETGEVMDL